MHSTMSLPWIEKYRPEKLEEITGNDSLKEQLTKYSWKKPLLLYGPSGVGKTLLVELLVKEINFDLITLDKANLSRAEEISQTGSLFGNKILLLIEHVDTISQIKTVTELLKKTSTPTILLTSDFKSKRLQTIKRICEKFQIRRPRATTIAKFLSKICAQEGIKVTSEILEKIAENAAGDFRAAILDLEAVGRGKKEIKETDLEILESRDKVSDIYKALTLILVKEDIKKSQESTYDLDEKPDNVLLWINENLPKVYPKKDLKIGFQYLSRADVFLGRIHKRQYWGFLRYANTLMTSGVTASKSGKISYVRYQFPFYIIHLSQTKKARNLKQQISQKLSKELHTSSRVINKEYLPLFKILLKNKKITSNELSEKFKFTEEELDFLETEQIS